MKSRILGVVFIGVVFINLSSASDEAKANVLSNEEHSQPSDEHKLLLECQHSDYRTYIKCLKRQKRHHGHGEDTGGSRSCFEDCGMDRCASTSCVHECHTRCMKKTKETRQIITQYESDCGSEDCSTSQNSKSDSAATNITTNIDINNVINNHIPKEINRPVPPSPYPPNHPCSHGQCDNMGSSMGTSMGFGMSLVPQIQLVPQLTFGIGMGPVGGCVPSMSWPCLQQPMQPSGTDCSQCGNPFLRYRCDASCYSFNNNSRPTGY